MYFVVACCVIQTTLLLLTCLMWIGLSVEELERLATLGTRAQKTARRDIAHVVSTFGISTHHIHVGILFRG